MTEISLYKGLCTDLMLNPVLLDGFLSQRLKRRGFLGSRTKGECTFTTTSIKHAQHYADAPEELVKVSPSPGSLISWAHNVSDMIIDFETFIRDNCYEPHPKLSRNSKLMIDDVRGCTLTFQEYVRCKIQPKSYTQIVDLYLDSLHLKEVHFKSMNQLESDLDAHSGEVWITGGCSLERYAPYKNGNHAIAA